MVATRAATRRHRYVHGTHICGTRARAASFRQNLRGGVVGTKKVDVLLGAHRAHIFPHAVEMHGPYPPPAPRID